MIGASGAAGTSGAPGAAGAPLPGSDSFEGWRERTGRELRERRARELASRRGSCWGRAHERRRELRAVGLERLALDRGRELLRRITQSKARL